LAFEILFIAIGQLLEDLQSYSWSRAFILEKLRGAATPQVSDSSVRHGFSTQGNTFQAEVRECSCTLLSICLLFAVIPRRVEQAS
jgi:hypothetical protein